LLAPFQWFEAVNAKAQAYLTVVQLRLDLRQHQQKWLQLDWRRTRIHLRPK
jgi:hypothetical protein